MIVSRHIEATEGGVRLDAALLKEFPSSSRALVREAIEDGRVTVNGRTAVKGLKLRGGERIEVAELAETKDITVLPDPKIKVKRIFEDEWLLAFDKPAGQSVQPLSRKETGTLMNGVVARYPECADVGDQPLMAGALHRIDTGTSGLVLAARTQEAFDGLRSQFAAQAVEKTYLALVEGAVAAGATLEHDLTQDRRLPYCKMIPGGKLHAVTSFTPIKHLTVENEARTLLEVKIFTGVTHQIRAQLALAGMHIVNDRLYGAFAVENMTGHALHALAAKFVHPVLHQPVEIRTPYPHWAL